MKPKTIIKIIVDVIMTVLFIVCMGYHLTENKTHEWLGTVLFALFILHHILNFGWYKSIFKGKYSFDYGNRDYVIQKRICFSEYFRRNARQKIAYDFYRLGLYPYGNALGFALGYGGRNVEKGNMSYFETTAEAYSCGTDYRRSYLTGNICLRNYRIY